MVQHPIPKNTLTRRRFLTGTAAAMMTGSNLALAQGSGKGPPNVLLIISDDLNDSIAGMGGHAQAKTPNIERLMKRGVRFNNAHCATPLCGPSRASLWSGLYPHRTGNHGYDQNACNWRLYPRLKEARTVFEHFRDNGYDVLGTGKIFHNGQEDNSVWRRDADGFNGLGVWANHGPTPWHGKKGGGRKARLRTGHSSMPPPYNKNYFTSFAPLSDVPQTPPDSRLGTPGYKGWWLRGKPFRYVSETDRDLMPDEMNAEWAVKRLGEKRDRPFLLAVGMNRPHAPYYAPKKYFDMFPANEMIFPPYLENDLEDCAEILWKRPGGRRTGQAGALLRLRKAGGDDLWRRWIQAYLACVAFVDDQVGKILDALEQSPFADNTIIVFTSDHGYHMGEKDNLAKQTVWEESTRVPLVVVAPGLTRAGQECPLPVSHIDLYPTLADLCGLPGDANAGGNKLALDGHSLRPLLRKPRGGKSNGPRVALTSRAGAGKLAPNEPGKVEDQHYTVRSRRWRYVLCSDGSEELYDHRLDPQEWTNLARTDTYDAIKGNLRRQLLRMTGRATG
jgi:arylsulfatase A-like enzyme